VLVFELARHGVRKILLLAAFHALKIIDYAASTPQKARFGLEIVVSVEPQPAGTAARCGTLSRLSGRRTPNAAS